MHKTFILLGLLCLGITSFGQESIKIREIGLYTKNLSDFGIRYKTGNEKLLYRFTSTLIDFTHANYSDRPYIESSSSFGMSFSVGIEKHIPVDKRFGFFYGTDFGFGFGYQKQTPVDPDATDYKSNSIDFSLGAILGCKYNLADNVSMAAEFVPGIVYERSTIEDSTINTWNFSLNSGYVGITFGYQF